MGLILFSVGTAKPGLDCAYEKSPYDICKVLISLSWAPPRQTSVKHKPSVWLSDMWANLLNPQGVPIFVDGFPLQRQHVFLTFDLMLSVDKILNYAWLIFGPLTLVLLNPDIPCLCKQCKSRSVGFFWRSQLIWICTVCHSVCEFISKARIK